MIKKKILRDTALLTLINGAKYSSDPHMVIASIFLGRILMLLYSSTHKVPWYTLVQYAMEDYLM